MSTLLVAALALTMSPAAATAVAPTPAPTMDPLPFPPDPLPGPTSIPIMPAPCPLAYTSDAVSEVAPYPYPCPIPVPCPVFGELVFVPDGCPIPEPIPVPCVEFGYPAEIAPVLYPQPYPQPYPEPEPEPCPVPLPCPAFGDPALVPEWCPIPGPIPIPCPVYAEPAFGESVVFPDCPIPTPAVLEVTPGTVELGEFFSLSATACPGPFPVGADYSVTFRIEYLTPPQLPGAPFPGSYFVELSSTNIGNETYVATWSLPSDAPTLGGAYRVSADCIANELGGEFVWFSYPSVPLNVVETTAPVLTATPETVQAGDALSVTATGCPTPPYIGADYRVEYLLSSLEVPGFVAEAVVPGAFGDHAATMPIPLDAPNGLYQLEAFCLGNELGGNFVAFQYDSVDVVVEGGDPGVLCNGLVVTVFIERGDQPTNGDDVILGTEGRDWINSRGGNDTICALGGRDRILGGSGNDVIFGGDGADTIYGGSGLDTIHGERGRDTIRGGRDGDLLIGGAGADVIRGQAGDDTLIGGGGSDFLHGGSGWDLCSSDRRDRVRRCEGRASLIW